ncbi:hypothetical protein B5S32_g4584 [[Candida] boidinii]|uniref:Unnamed protein product n=1 Tax=Candida boidinii TaxID=5477 RepID=A0ACB5U295_CANBO|nr:hypothetical protein B5S32_g4584 [[Candida] boidinii]GMF00372.1 unnamed protein product [[Candida] boidinii]
MKSTSSFEISDAKSEATIDANILPCCVEYTGKVATVSQFFNQSTVAPAADDSIQPQEIVYFRGRKLLNQEIDLNKMGYTGHLVMKSNDTGSGGVDTEKYVSTRRVRQINNYGHEQKPGVNDSVNKVLEWVSLSNLIHDDDETAAEAGSEE